MNIQYTILDSYDIIYELWSFFAKQLDYTYTLFDYMQFYAKYRKYCFIAKHDGKLISGVLSRTVNNRAYIAFVGTDKLYRRKGICEKLIRLSLDSFRKMGFRSVCITTEVHNTAALTLYTKLGFVKRNYHEKHYENEKDGFFLKMNFDNK